MDRPTCPRCHNAAVTEHSWSVDRIRIDDGIYERLWKDRAVYRLSMTCEHCGQLEATGWSAKECLDRIAVVETEAS